MADRDLADRGDRALRVLRVVLAVVAAEAVVAVVVSGDRLAPVLTGRGRPVDYLAVAALGSLAGVALLTRHVSRHVAELGRRVTAQAEHLAATEEPRRRRAAASGRTHDLLSHPELLGIALQPVVDLAESRWTGCEALARFPHAPAPDRWFAEAHDAGLGVSLELLAVRRAVTSLPCLPPGVGLSVNASPALVLDPGFAAELAGSTEPGRLTVEITEHAAVARYEDIAEALAPHRARGVVTAVVLMALELGAEVTAEGVETAAELDTLRSLGVDAVQGYLLARPSTDQADWAAWATRDWSTPGSAPVDLRPRARGVTYG